MLKVLDLFSGIGGFSLGLERTGGFETVAFCEIEEFPRKVLRRHWPEVPIYDDVRTLTAAQLARDGISVDVICGGFPCQDISPAGKGEGINGRSSSLWFQFDRIIGEIRPRYIIVENSGALSYRGLSDVLGCLATRGYDAEWAAIPAGGVGAPHWRERTWIVAYPERGERREESYIREIGRMGWIKQQMAWDEGWEAALARFRRVDDGIPRSVASTDGYRNAVVPQVVEMLGCAILEQTRKEL
ncbi:DNA cytosine methyltransferase [Thalassospira alkalitolerans]|uniref:DNA cytosine methyltransferase n=1 Tax=Thalassospira alkalitolerans TaxID=1293890 RepID=UPI003AA8F933